jgi:hypothetical protein
MWISSPDIHVRIGTYTANWGKDWQTSVMHGVNAWPLHACSVQHGDEPDRRPAVAPIQVASCS